MRRTMACITVAVLGTVASAVVAAADADMNSRGMQAFTHRCGMCHREGGTGTYMLARRLGQENALLERRRDLQPLYIRTVVRSGLQNMPRISRVEVPDADMDAIVAYLTAPKPAAAQ